MKRLLLFDIDGTLITGHGIPKERMIQTVKKHFPDFRNGNEVAFSGMTDPLIVQKICEANGHPLAIDNPMIKHILDDFVVDLKAHVSPKQPPTVLPGVKTLLEKCDEQTGLYPGLVTGNMAQGALIKLKAAGLENFFAVGAFGSDHWDRNMLPPIALKRAQTYFKQEFAADEIWIIGDSVKDVDCAKANGFKCLAVLTGRTDRADLAQADFIMEDLQNIDQFYNYVTG